MRTKANTAAAAHRRGFFFIHIHIIFSSWSILLCMQTLVHADIFFFISTICLVLLSILVEIGLYYAIGILRDVREVTARINKASTDIERDLDALRYSVKAEGAKVKGIADLVLGFITRALTPKPVKRKKPRVIETDVEDDFVEDAE
jgi:hypothetical protein